ncbi:UTRA domain-containing protein [Pseudomonas sp. MWU16-30317]|uniref:UTRA domain-containing protein n=1 Tax=Pseudomonas sp. MWU16-30317 TaxID=2878095 RepID=UPI001CFA2287|nr:UTRA domain-containing protein [Pseudomonas sp. MWU16-30317]
MSNKAPQHQYLRISEQLSADLDAGRLQRGERLAPEREMAEHFGCTRVTLRQALQRLEAQGSLYRGPRRGWFVSPLAVHYDPTRTTSFMDYVTAQGREPRTECLIAEYRPAGPWLAAKMQVDAAEPVYWLQRRRWVDGVPVLLETNVLRASNCPDLLDQPLNGSLTTLLRERFDRRLARSEISLKPLLLDQQQSDLLDIAEGSNGLHLQRLCFDQSGAVVEYDQEHWRADAVEVVMAISG